MKTLAVIPARMASSRFPGKPLQRILGLPMVEHVRRRTLMCSRLDRVVVATCDREIYDAVRGYGGDAVMTSDRHEGCIDRVAEAAGHFPGDIVVNVQGDMPLVTPGSLEQLVAPFTAPEVLFTDMMGLVTDPEEFQSPNVVKVVVDFKMNALYYSREPIPSLKKAENERPPIYKQFGINAFRRDSLAKFVSFPRQGLERIESVDMLRLLENGYKVRMVLSADSVVGVDTPDDLRKAERLMKNDSLFPRYSNPNP
jgi:3-deoxy-manno-octulosonate cytidylyltransferase (CMP-KDO synthetase)